MADFLSTDDVLDNLDVDQSMQAAEFGCGSAEFTIKLARKLPKGRVYALDIQEQRLSALRGKISRQKLTNIFTVRADLEAKNGSKFQGNLLDIVLMPNILFQAENKRAIIEEGKRVLKPGGQLLIVDWLKKHSFGPEELIPPEEVKKIAQHLGLSLKREFASGDYHYVLLFTKDVA